MVSFPFRTGLCAAADSEANTDFLGDVIQFLKPSAKVCDRAKGTLQRSNFNRTHDAGKTLNNRLYLDTIQFEPVTNNDA